FELTPEGIRRSEEIPPREPETSKTGSRWTAIIVAAAVLAAALFAFQFARTRKVATAELPKQTAPAATLDKSVAVLPFENLSSDKENVFFAQGIQDEIITTLSRISGLRVISRTSTVRYSSAPENLPEIARQLRASDYQTRPDNLLQDFRSAINLYDQAIKLDPKFALAHARLSATASFVYHFYEPTETWKQKADAEALESLRLQPNLGEAHLALGLYHYYVEGDYDAALRQFGVAAEALPNDGDVGLYTAAVLRRSGHWTQALAAYQHAEQLDPRNAITLYDASQTYFGLRDWQKAAEGMDRVLALFPDSFNVKIQRAYIEFYWKGSTAPIKAALQSLPPNLDPDGVVTFARWDVSLMDRDVNAADKALTACQLDTISSQTGV